MKTWLAVKGISAQRKYLKGFPRSQESMPLGQLPIPTIYKTCFMWNNQAVRPGGQVFIRRDSPWNPRNGITSLRFEPV